MNINSELKHEYHFKDNGHFIETPFVQSDEDAKHNIINTSSFKGSFIEYSNGVCVLVVSGVAEGKVTYYTNYPLKEISPNRFEFNLS
ncbi:hypothetical protein [Enterococcus sp. DIV1444a]|uniref:hypothetical protein n=1 Tax=Enterococcus sp. DIV1444a TaxID=2774679 RepID=UPI00372AA611